MFYQMETFMPKAFRDEAVVNLSQVSNNAGHGSLRMARRVKFIQDLVPQLGLYPVNDVYCSEFLLKPQYCFFSTPR